MLRPRVELSTTGDMVHLVCDQNGGHAHEMDADEAWDLGDDLVTGALGVMDKQGKLQWQQSEPPEWLTKIRVTGHGGTMLECDTCGPFVDLGYDGATVGEVYDLAREHWRLMHSDVAEDAEGEDEDGHGEPAQADAAGEIAGGQDREDRRDEVKERSQHVVWNTRPADRGNRLP